MEKVWFLSHQDEISCCVFLNGSCNIKKIFFYSISAPFFTRLEKKELTKAKKGDRQTKNRGNRRYIVQVYMHMVEAVIAAVARQCMSLAFYSMLHRAMERI